MRRRPLFPLLLLAALCAVLRPLPCLGEGAADYNYSVEITLSNTGGSGIAGPVPVPINALNLISGGFLQADGRDSLFTDSGHVPMGGTGQDLGQNAATWWWSTSIPAGSSRIVKLFLGGPDADHSLPLGEGDAVTVPDDATLDITTNLTVEVSVILDSLPPVRESLLEKQGQYLLSVDPSSFAVAAIGTSVADAALYLTGYDDAKKLSDTLWEAQTFTVTQAGGVYRIKALYALTGSPTIVYAGIKAVDDSGKPTGPFLATGQKANPQGGGLWDATTLYPAYFLEADTQYALILYGYNDPNNYVSWQCDSTSPAYDGGNRVYSSDGGNSWTVDNSRDFMFQMEVYASASASAAASTGTHTVTGTADGTDLKLYVDGEEVASTAFAGPIRTGSEDISIAFAGSVRRARIGGTSVETPTWVLDLQFEPDQMSQTQVGTAENGWEWTGTVQDQSASGNDGTYSIIRDTTELTVKVGGLVIKPEPPPGPASVEYPDVVGDLPVGVIFTPEPTISSPLIDPIRELAEESGMPSQAWWLLLTTIVSAVASSVVFRFLPSFAGSAVIGGTVFLVMGLMGHMDKWIIVLFGIWAVGIICVHQYWGSGR